MTRGDIESVRLTTGNWGKTKAFATVTFTNGLVMGGVKVIDAGKGLFVGMPSRPPKKDGDKKWSDICYLPDEENKKIFNDVILAAYEKETGSNHSSTPSKKQESKDTSGSFLDDDIF